LKRLHLVICFVIAMATVALGSLCETASCASHIPIQEEPCRRNSEARDGRQPAASPGYFADEARTSPAAKSPDLDFGQPLFEPQAPVDAPISKERLRSLMRPTIALRSEWLSSSDFNFSTNRMGITVPGYPIFGPPPPMIRGEFAYTDLADGEAFGLPAALYEYSIGASWVRPINDRWMVRTMLGVALATDNRNLSSDAWQFRGGVFAVYEPDEQWQWVVGAVAIGRSDLPAVPAAGLIWKPRPDFKCDLTFPKPTLSMLIADNGSRQQWSYIAMGLGGGTSAFERTDRTDDQVTYRDWRLVAGWESSPKPLAGERFTPGFRVGAEVGYVFSRDLEFRSGAPDISLSDAFVLDISTRF
jgi:Domain of unknown function (DUF6268)